METLQRVASRVVPGEFKPAAQHAAFVVLLLMAFTAFSGPLTELVRTALNDERYTHILIVPFTVGGLIWLRREQTFSKAGHDLAMGVPCLAGSASALWITGVWPKVAGEPEALTFQILASVFACISIFVTCYGKHAFRSSLFPLMFLFAAVPLPVSFVSYIVRFLQRASADASGVLFTMTGVPVFREGFAFLLPGVEIQVAEECSGIRSSQSLFLSSILAGRMFLRSRWSIAWVALLTVPIVILKNAVRIVTISLLGVYVDRGFLTGNLHQYSGLPFSLIAVVLLVFVLVGFRRIETRNREAIVPGPGGGRV